MSEARQSPLIYIAGALTEAKDTQLGVYKDIQAGCRAAGFDAYLPHEDTGARKDNLEPTRVSDANLAAINRSSGLIADVSVASHGVGIEIQYAASRGIRILAIARERANLSRMVLGHSAIGHVYRYKGRQRVDDLVEKALLATWKGYGTRRNRLLAIEGPDFAGKSTIARYLVQESARLFERDSVLVTDPPWKLEPWESLGGIFREDEHLSGPAEALLFGTARIDNYYRCIRPALDQNKVVICDRYIDSWFAYQSVRLAEQGGKNALEFLLTQQTMMESFGHIEPPGLTLLLMANLDVLKTRSAGRGGRDKYERWGFLTKVMATYEELYARFPYRIIRLETTGRETDDIKSYAAELIRDYLRHA